MKTKEILDEKIFKESDNAYTYWVAIEVTKESILNQTTSKISKNENCKNQDSTENNN